jgi:hypothetical protein
LKRNPRERERFDNDTKIWFCIKVYVLCREALRDRAYEHLSQRSRNSFVSSLDSCHSIASPSIAPYTKHSPTSLQPSL